MGSRVPNSGFLFLSFCFWKLKKLIHKSNGFDYCWLARRIQDLNVPAASNLPTILPWVFWSPKAKELKERPEGRIHIRCRHLHFQSLKTRWETACYLLDRFPAACLQFFLSEKRFLNQGSVSGSSIKKESISARHFIIILPAERLIHRCLSYLLGHQNTEVEIVSDRW